MASGRVLVIDYYASRLRGVMTGDLVVRFGDPDNEPRYVQLAALEGVAVLSERSLLSVLNGAVIRQAGPPFARHLALTLRRPEAWFAFLEHRAQPRH